MHRRRSLVLHEHAGRSAVAERKVIMNMGVIVVADEDGNIVEESTTVIEDGITTWIKNGNHYEKADRI